jgi:pilus assembly protein CpaF
MSVIDLDRSDVSVSSNPLVLKTRPLTARHQELKFTLHRKLLDEVFGLGPLEMLLQDDSISDILVNGHNQVYIEKCGRLELTAVVFKDNSHLLRIIDKIVSQVGRRIDESSPMVDARLMDGSRVNAIIPPLAVDGPLLSIRRFGTDKLMPADLVEKQSMTDAMLQLIEACVKTRLNIVVSGGTGSGKPRYSTLSQPSSLPRSESSRSRTQQSFS